MPRPGSLLLFVGMGQADAIPTANTELTHIPTMIQEPADSPRASALRKLQGYVWMRRVYLIEDELKAETTHHLTRVKSMVSNPRIEYKSEFSNLV